MTTNTAPALAPATVDSVNPDEPVFVPCGRCGGDGVVHYGRVTLAREEAGHVVEDRFCFWCHGSKGKWSTVGAEAKKEAAREKARLRREAKKVSEREANLDAFAAQAAEIPGLDEALLFGSEIGHGLLVDLGLKTGSYGRLSAAQVDLALRVAAEAFEALIEEEAKPAPSPVVEGRVEITGEILTLRYVETGFAPALKMRVRDDRGFAVWGTCPATIADPLFDTWLAEEQAAGYSSRDFGPSYWTTKVLGARVTFTATVERSDDDDLFGFFKRPTKARVL